MIDISVIVPVYKVEKYLEKCLNGILEQTHKNFELILVNDGSPDRSGEICDTYEKKDSRIKVIHQTNRGVAEARNKGLEIAQGTYIYFCDPDDYIESNLLEDNFNLMEKYSANMVVFGYYNEKITRKGIRIRDNVPGIHVFLETKENFRNKFEILFSAYIMYTLWNKLYRKSYLIENNCRFESVKVGEDTKFNYSIYKNIDKVFVNRNKYYHYVLSRQDSAASSYRIEKFELRYKETKELQELIEGWNYSKKYQNLVYNDWLVTLLTGVENLLHDDCPLSNKEIIEQIYKYCQRKEIKIMLRNLSLKQFSGTYKEKIKKYLIKNINNKFVFYIYKYIL